MNRLLERLFRATARPVCHVVTDPRCVVETLEIRRFLSAGTVRVVSYNIDADTDGNTSANPGLQTVLEGIGAESFAGNAQPIDVLGLEETTSNSLTVQPIVNALNAHYGSGTYAYSTLQGNVAGNSPTVGNGPNALIYNTTTLNLLSSYGVTGQLGSSTSGVSRQIMRYQFKAIGTTAGSDFYVYVQHYKSGQTSSDQTARQKEAAVVRNDAATLPASARIIYSGDFNTSTDGEGIFANLMAPGAGQAFDPVNPTGGPNDIDEELKYLSFSPTSLNYRDDYQMVTGNVLNDTGGLHYLGNSFRVFGNNGSVAKGRAVTNASNTALAGLPNRSAVLSALTTASDHLPVVADYTVPIAPTGDPQSVTLQAENAALSGGTATASTNTGYTGTGYADYGAMNSAVQFTTTRVASGAVNLVLRYANGSTSGRPLSVMVNGVNTGSFACAPTGSWTTWSTVTVPANLTAGSNTIKAVASSSVGGANVDSLTIDKSSGAVTYQAEDATLAGGTSKSTGNAGYTGAGYADFGSTNSSVQFAVTRTTSGSTTLSFRYANGSAANRPVNLTVNGTVVGSLAFAPTGSWSTWSTLTLNVNLTSGTNIIKLTVTGPDGPNLDALSVG